MINSETIKHNNNQIVINHPAKKIKLIASTGILAAIITIMTAYIGHIPIGNGYIHIGDALIYLGASILPLPFAIAAAAIGGGLADLLTAPVWVLSTIIIKSLLTLIFSRKSNKIVTKRNIIATIIAFFVSSTGYFIAEVIIYGLGSNTLFLAYIYSASGNLIQAIGSGIFYVFLGLTLDKVGFKNKFYN